MTNEQTIRAFVQGTREQGQNSTGSIYFDDLRVLYSYGSHFPMCVRYKGQYFVNCYNYSNSTAKHLSILRSKLDSYIEAPTNALQGLVANNISWFRTHAIEYHKQVIKYSENKLKRARVEHSRDDYRRNIEESLTALNIIEGI